MSHQFSRWIVCSLVMMVAGISATVQAADPAEPALVPWPTSVKVNAGTMPLTSSTRIVAATKPLSPLADVLANEIAAVTGIKPQTVVGGAKPGDILLQADGKKTGEQYTLNVNDRATIHGDTYGAVAMGSITLLQSITKADDGYTIAKLQIKDQPKNDFRGLMIDVARQYHTIDNLKQIVELCRLYKIRYLHLHLTDDQSFMFPSKAFPLLATQNQTGGKTYTIDELKGLVAYADARYVTIIPEFDVPGHSAAANRAMTDLFKIKGTKPYEHHASINIGKDDVLKAVATIVGEMCDVFQSSPYFHIGGDEADLQFAQQNKFITDKEKELGLSDQHELYQWFIVHMNDVVKKNGKQMIVWEGFTRGSKVKVPKDVIVMAYEIRFYMPQELLKDGYRVINSSWTPLYVTQGKHSTPKDIYAWKLTQFKPFGAKPTDEGTIVPDSKLLIGATMCSWEQKQDQELPSLRDRVAAMSERIWNPDAGKSYDDFAGRYKATDAILDALVKGK
jgi:hexosaminidase